MKFLDKLIRKPVTFQRTTGLPINLAKILAYKLKPLWNNAEKERLNHPDRKRKIGGGHPYKAETIFEKMMIVLIYYKTNVTQEFLATILGMDQSAVSRLISKIMPLIEEAADPELRTYLAKAKENIKAKRINNLQELVAMYPDLRDVSTDATEQQCYRATEYERQKEYYSGKSKQHAIKTQISVSSTGRILDVSDSYPGSMHDKPIIEKEKTIEKFDERVPHRLDSGYQGIQKNHPSYYIITPFKKPKNEELSPLLKEHNRCNSKRRVIAEHGLSRIKKFKAFANIFRQPIKKYNQAFRAVAAILNFKWQNVELSV